MRTLFDYQQSALDSVLSTLYDGNKPLIVMPTGGGKTSVAGALVSELRSVAKIMIVVPLEPLIDQFLNTLLDFDIAPDEIGVLQGSSSDSVERLYDSRVIVAMAQSVVGARGSQIIKELGIDMVIADEAHLAILDNAIACASAPLVVGMTATPNRFGGGEVLDSYSWVTPITTVELIERDRLVPYEYFVYSEAHKAKGDEFTQREMQQITEAIPKEYVLDKWLMLSNKSHSIGFCTTVEECWEYADYFTNAGYPSGVVSAEVKSRPSGVCRVDGAAPEFRQDYYEDLRSGVLKALFSVGVLAVGFDEPSAETLLCLRPTMSLALWVQMIGRILRTSPDTGKTVGLILDFVGNGFVHPLPAEIKDWRDIPAPTGKVCLECSYRNIKTANLCTMCGTELPCESRGDNGGGLKDEGEVRVMLGQMVGTKIVSLLPPTEALKELRLQAFLRNHHPNSVFAAYYETFDVYPQRDLFDGAHGCLQGAIAGSDPNYKTFIAVLAWLKRHYNNDAYATSQELAKEFNPTMIDAWAKQLLPV
jgi:DNA repair protein RadD